jgi:hypothetical protein
MAEDFGGDVIVLCSLINQTLKKPLFSRREKQNQNFVALSCGKTGLSSRRQGSFWFYPAMPE